MRFKNRMEAGQRLARKVEELRLENPIIVALPRGGVPVAAEIARALSAPLDVFLVRKVGLPQNPEYAIGAIAEGGLSIIDRETTAELGISESAINRQIAQARDELERRARALGRRNSLRDVRGRNVVLVDDGLATGLTATVAIRALKQAGARKVVLAAPVCAAPSVRRLEREADQVACVLLPENLIGVGLWYEDFSQLSDDDVLESLASLRHTAAPRDFEVNIPVMDPPPGHAARGMRRTLPGTLTLPPSPKGLVLFAHGSGSSRNSPRNVQVAERLQQEGIATLLFDLLFPEEAVDRAKVFDVPLLASRLQAAARFVRSHEESARLPIGYFGASTGGAAALWAAADAKPEVVTVVSRGGRPDLAMSRLARVSIPVLLLVGGDDRRVLELNQVAKANLGNARLTVIPGATHVFEEPGTLEAVADHAAHWFSQYFLSAPPRTQEVQGGAA